MYVNDVLSTQADINDSYRYTNNYLGFYTKEENPNEAWFDNFSIQYNGSTGEKINWNITINAVNDPPYWSGNPANRAVDEETQDSIILSSFIADVDDSDTVLGISYATNDTAKAAITLDNSSKNLSIVASANQTGLFSINLTVFDDDGASSAERKQINWTINNVNDPPVIDPAIGNQNVNEDNAFTLNLSQYSTDVDTVIELLNWSWSLNLTSLVTVSINNATNFLTVTPATNQSGIALLGLTIYDNGSLTDEETINFTVNAVNDPPYWITSPVDQLTDEDTSDSYDVSSIVSDVDDVNSVLGVSYRANDTGIATFSISNVTKVITINTIANKTGIIKLNLTIYDDAPLATHNMSINWSVSDVNDPPVIDPTIGNNSTNEDTPFNLDLTVYETDVDSVDFNWSWSTNGSTLITPSLNNATNLLTVTPAANATGSVILQLTLHDNVSSTDVQNLTIDVIGINDPPYVNPGLTNNASLLNTTFTLDLTAHDNDVDGSDFNWSYAANSTLPASISINNNTDVLIITAGNTSGLTRINLTLYDNQSAQYNTTFNFTIGYNPSFISVFSYPTYVTVNRTQTANFTIRTNQSINASVTNLTITDPNGVVTRLNSVNTTIIADKTFEYNFTFTPKAVGTYNLAFTLNDTSYPTTNSIQKNFSLYSVNAESVNFTAPGVQRITIKDINSKDTLYSGSNVTLTDFPPGSYYIEIHSTDANAFVILGNVTLNATINQTLNYTDTDDTIALPASDVKNINQFFINSSLAYQNITITYNYAGNLTNISFENRLRLYKCNSSSSCSWTFINGTIDTNQDNITINLTSLSVFNLVEQNVDTTTTTTTSTSGGGGGTSIQITDLTILQPSPISLFEQETIITPIIVRNNGDKALNGITLTITTNDNSLGAVLAETSIATLSAKSEKQIDLTLINSGLTLGQYEVVVTANVENPLLLDEGKIYVDVVERFFTEKTQVREQVNYLDELFNLNPECSELRDLLVQVQASFDNEEFDKALEYANNAIESCKGLVSSSGKELVLPKTTGSFSNTIILALEVIGAVFVLMFIYNYYRRRKRIERFKKRY